MSWILSCFTTPHYLMTAAQKFTLSVLAFAVIIAGATTQVIVCAVRDKLRDRRKNVKH